MLLLSPSLKLITGSSLFLFYLLERICIFYLYVSLKSGDSSLTSEPLLLLMLESEANISFYNIFRGLFFVFE